MIKRTLCLAYICLLILTMAACRSAPLGGIPDPNDEWDSLTSSEYGTVPVTSAKTAYNYLTGEMNMAQDRVGLRPYCVSVNNLEASWPQKGIEAADIILEMETEGGITRMMCLYTDTREISLIGSVRSLRDQFIEAIYPVDPIIVHIGTSTYADKAISDHGLQTIDGNRFPSAIYIDPERQNYHSEHTKFTSGLLIHNAIDKLNINPESRMKHKSFFPFVPEGQSAVMTTTGLSRISFLFSNTGYDGDFRYDSDSDSWYKFQHNQPQIDSGLEAEGAQLHFTNVLILFADIRTIENTKGLVSVNYQTGGTGIYCTGDGLVEFTWSKGDYESLFQMVLTDGSDLMLNPGKTMMCIVRNTYQDSLELTYF